MKYTWRVAMETLRMVPPAFGNFRKALKDIEYGGYLIPKGWQVSKSFVPSLLSHYISLFETIIQLILLYFDIQILWTSPMTHMDNSIFPEPSKFDPSRFENQSSIPPYSFIAFGGGPRICPGYEFARLETLVTIHYLVTQFTWKLCADNSFSRDPTPTPTQGLPIKLVPRKLC
jgi:cytochrome P450